MQNKVLYILLGLVAAILVIRASVFTVTEGRLAIKSVGGNIVDSNIAPGLHFRIPLVEEVALFDKRIITQLYPAERFLTREQEQLNVDFYVKWRINDLRRYYEATGGTEEVANARLGETIKDSIKSVVTQRTLQQVITAERAEFTDAMMKNARPAAEQLGVQLVDVRITKIDLPQQVRDSVFDRMRATFKAQAAKASRRRNGPAPKRTSSKPRSWPTPRAMLRRSAGRAMPRRARCTRSRIRKMRSSTVSTAACSPIVTPSARRAMCWSSLRTTPTSSISSNRSRSANSSGHHDGNWLERVGALSGRSFCTILGARRHTALLESERCAAPDGQVGPDRNAAASLGRIDQHGGGPRVIVDGAQWVRTWS